MIMQYVNFTRWWHKRYTTASVFTSELGCAINAAVAVMTARGQWREETGVFELYICLQLQSLYIRLANSNITVKAQTPTFLEKVLKTTNICKCTQDLKKKVSPLYTLHVLFDILRN